MVSFRKKTLDIAPYLDPDCVHFLEAEDRDSAIDCLIDLLLRAEKLEDRASFRRAIFQREELVSTGIGMGVAIPHAKMSTFSDFCVAIGIQKKQGIPWNSVDMGDVRIVFLIGGPDSRQTEYLQLLSFFTSVVKDPELRKKLLQMERADEVIRLFQNFL